MATGYILLWQARCCPFAVGFQHIPVFCADRIESVLLCRDIDRLFRFAALRPLIDERELHRTEASKCSWEVAQFSKWRSCRLPVQADSLISSKATVFEYFRPVTLQIPSRYIWIWIVCCARVRFPSPFACLMISAICFFSARVSLRGGLGFALPAALFLRVSFCNRWYLLFKVFCRSKTE